MVSKKKFLYVLDDIISFYVPADRVEKDVYVIIDECYSCTLWFKDNKGISHSAKLQVAYGNDSVNLFIDNVFIIELNTYRHTADNMVFVFSDMMNIHGAVMREIS